MYIKEVIIDGFKSYQHRTVIPGFDPQFNAITGLNGSGKSNILDAICFVLGLSTLSLARVNSLQELIYKFGHAGVTKASVSIVFDNTDKKSSPVGFENCDTIIVTRMISGGKSKYLLNGHNESNQKIKNMFKTIGLNIDNPHFLVAQGRITKIINLRPAELISMLEETAGTSLYNEKKKESLRIIDKKEEKVREMNDLLKTDIEPQMEKLRKEREIYLQWKSGQIELEKLIRYIRAYDYYEQRKLLESRNLDLVNLKSSEHDVSKRLRKNVDRVRRIKDEIEEYKSKRTANMFENYKELEDQCKTKKKEIADLETELKNLNKNIKESEREKDDIEANIAELEAGTSRLEQKLAFLESNTEKQNRILKERKDLYENNERQLKALLKGDKVGTEDSSYMIDNQIKEAEVNRANTISEIKQYERKREHITQELQQMKSSIENNITNTKNLQSEIDILNVEIEKTRKTLDRSEVSNDEYQDLIDEKRKHKDALDGLNNRLIEVLSSNPAFKLNYRDPEPSFDRRKVKGRVFQLFAVNDSKFIKPLEAIAGGRLFQIVVDNENTSKLLLKRNCFGGTGVVFIPNSKIVPNTIPQDVVERARQIAQDLGGDAAPAYSLIKYDAEFKPTMEYVFGNTIICSTTEIAKKIAFDQRIRRKCVNLEGDIFDPSGTLTGGYSNMNNSILTKFNEYKQHQDEYDERRKRVKTIEEKVEKYKNRLDEFQGLRDDCELKVHRLNLLDRKLKETASNKAQDKISNLDLQIKDLDEHIKSLEVEREAHDADLEGLNKDKTSTSKGQKSTKVILTEQNEKFKRELDKIQAEIKKTKNERTNLDVEKESNEQEIKRKKKGITEESNTIEKYKRNFEKITKDLEKLRNSYSKIDDEKRKLDKTLSSVDTKIAQDEKELATLETDNETYEKEAKRLEGQINRYSREVKEAQELVTNMEKALSWLVQEYDNFGLSGSEFDFDQIDVEGERSRYDNLKKYQENLSKRVNMKVEAMSDKVEKEYKTLLEKRMILETDKHTLNSNIEELDKKKKEALDKCWVEVNKDFGKIFSTLLHGASAKVQPLPNKELADGLEIKVAFHGTWKQSLSELSGGQRSLLALSFMLGLLLYKPAPLYVLDEIDAALDLSHTQNIGAMISQHFPQSQFVIISLKEGMFNNANILFKTSFVDGVSRVDRIELKAKPDKKNKKRNENMNIEQEK